AWTNCLEGLELLCVADLPLVKSPAHQPECQLALAFGSREPTCRLSPGKPRAQLPPPATQGRQPPPRFAPGFSVALLSAAERLSSKGYHTGLRVRAGAQFAHAISESFPACPVNHLYA